MSGWIKLHRDMRRHWLWENEEFTRGQAWIDLLLHANHSDKKVLIKKRLIDLKRGQQARSELTLSATWGWSRGKVRRFLKQLENEQMIVQQATQLTSIITICNYSYFQGGTATHSTTDSTTGGTANGQQAVHKQECKEFQELNLSSAPGAADPSRTHLDQPKKPKDCPHQKIIDLYHHHCPTMRQVKIWNGERAKFLQARWRESPKHQSLDFWAKFFDYANSSDFLRGDTGKFAADLEWLVRPTNFAKVVEGKYENQGVA